MIRVKTIREEFDAGEAGGYVYGEIRRQKILPVFVKLGIEQKYYPSPSDDPNTRYRLFSRCAVYVAETDEQLDRGEFIFRSLDTTVVIYC